jgi:putative cardiolipin synthase
MKSKTSEFRLAGIFVALMGFMMLSACASLPENVDRQPSTAFTDTANTALGNSIKDDLAEHHGLSGFHLLSRGLDAFAARALLA